MGAEAEGRKGLMGQDEEGACEGSKQRIHLSPVFTTEGQGKRGGDTETDNNDLCMLKRHKQTHNFVC